MGEGRGRGRELSVREDREREVVGRASRPSLSLSLSARTILDLLPGRALAEALQEAELGERARARHPVFARRARARLLPLCSSPALPLLKKAFERESKGEHRGPALSPRASDDGSRPRADAGVPFDARPRTRGRRARGLERRTTWRKRGVEEDKGRFLSRSWGLKKEEGPNEVRCSHARSRYQCGDSRRRRLSLGSLLQFVLCACAGEWRRAQTNKRCASAAVGEWERAATLGGGVGARSGSLPRCMFCLGLLGGRRAPSAGPREAGCGGSAPAAPERDGSGGGGGASISLPLASGSVRAGRRGQEHAADWRGGAANPVHGRVPRVD